MNENKGKMSTVLIIALIVIIILLVSVVLLLVKNQTTTNVAQTGNESNVESIVENTDTENNPEGMNTKVVTKEMTAEEKYKIYAEGMKNSLSKFKDAGETPNGDRFDLTLEEYEHTTVDIDSDDGVSGVVLDNTGTAYLRLDKNSILGKKYGTEYKIKSNVINVGITEHGQDYFYIIWFIDEEGKVSYINNDDDTLEVKENNNLKNIVDIKSIDTGSGISVFAIDIEGNIDELEIVDN